MWNQLKEQIKKLNTKIRCLMCTLNYIEDVLAQNDLTTSTTTTTTVTTTTTTSTTTTTTV